MKGGLELETRKHRSIGPKIAPPLNSCRVNVLHPGASAMGIDERRPVSMSCRSSGEACVESLEFWNFTVRCTTSFWTCTFDTQIVYPFSSAQGPGEQFSGLRLLLGCVV